MIRKVDLASRKSTDIIALPAALDVQRAPDVVVDSYGHFALVHTCTEGQTPSLQLIDMQTLSAKTVFRASGENVLLTGVFTNEQPLVLEVTLGDAPRTRLLRLGSDAPETLFSADVTSPTSVPVVVGGIVFAALSENAAPFSSSGPSDFVAISLQSRSHRRLTTGGDVSGRARVHHESVLLEGGDAVWRLQIS